MGLGQFKPASMALLVLASVLIVPFAAASSGAVGVVLGSSTVSDHLLIEDAQANLSIELEEVANGPANVTVSYGLATLEGAEMSRNTTTVVFLPSTTSATVNLSIQNVPFGYSTMFVELSGDVASNSSTHVNAFTRTVHRLRPLSVGLGSTNSVVGSGLGADGNLTGNQTINEGDGLRLEVPIVNGGDVNWTGGLQITTDQFGIIQHHNATNVSVVSMTSTVVVGDFLDSVLEGELVWTAELVGAIGSDESNRFRNGTLEVLPPPLPSLSGLFAPFNESDLVAGQPFNLSLTVFNNGTAAFNGQIHCSDGTTELHQSPLSLAPGGNTTVAFEVSARPMTVVCTEAGQRISTSSSWPINRTINISSALFVIAGAPSPSLEGGPWHQGDVLSANLLIRNTGSLDGRLRLEVMDGSVTSAGDWVILPSGSAGEVRVNHAFSTVGDRMLEWRLISDNGGFTGTSNGSLPVSVLSPQSVSLSLDPINGSSERVVITATTLLDEGPAREVRIRAGLDQGSGPVYVYDQIRLLEPGQQTHEFDLGFPDGERVVVRVSPVGWSIGPGPLSVSTSLPEAITTYRMTMDPVLSPIRPVAGDEVTLTLLLEQSGSFQDSTSTLRLLDAYGQELSNISVDGWSTSGSMTESLVVEWPSGNNVLIRAHWDVNGQVITAQESYMSSPPTGDEGASIPWASLLWGSVLGGVLIAVLRVVVRTPSRASPSTPRSSTSPREPTTSVPTSTDEKRNVTCPACDRGLRVPTTYSGSVGCPDCSHKFSIEPEATGSPSTPALGMEETKITVYCPACVQSLRVPSSYTGSVRCPACTKVFKSTDSVNGQEP